MEPVQWKSDAARSSLTRLLPRIEKHHAQKICNRAELWPRFIERLEANWEPLFFYLQELYGWQYDFFYTLETIMDLLADYWLDRPEPLLKLDDKRIKDPEWFLSEDVAGIVLYVDLFSDNLAGLYRHIPYFEKLGVNYIHLMPLFTVPHGNNDGGYAVSDYRAVNPDLGTMAELEELASVLREKGISLVLDFVFNHTSDEHRWALKARAGDPDFMSYYFMFTDRRLVDRFQEHLRDIFPDIRKGCFCWNEETQRWVWTTFNNYQWDLNYSNPSVFRAMAEEMLFLANKGVEVLRLDAVAFIWKRLGTSCENQPEAHTIIRAFNTMAKIAAPAMLFKSEAIVHPDDVLTYIHKDECQLSYNPLLMALLWEALATRDTRLLAHSIRNRERLPDGCAWVNYLRCHDDIGWTFDDDDAWHLGINPQNHRRFLNEFYTGQYPGSFAKGIPFQYDPETGDLRISGTFSSLAGLEKALEAGDDVLIETAVRRVNMLRNIKVSIGGIPLLYAGDEYGELNDYTYLSDPMKATDTRWVHRARKRWEAAEDLEDQSTLEWRFFHEMATLFKQRKKTPALRNGGMEVVDTGNHHIFGYIRKNSSQQVLILNNFSEFSQIVPKTSLIAAGFTGDAVEIFTGMVIRSETDLEIDGYRYLWIDLTPG